ncbi:MAG TPA: ABC transporter permease [Chloroflexaceae bacterium]|nr:ABC transporter permease [Chloroflexaceae bacterium]
MAEARRGFTRRQFIAGFFALLGLLVIVLNVPGLAEEVPVVTRLALPQPVIVLPTALSLALIGAVWLAAGALSFVPRAERAATYLTWAGAALIIPAVLIWAAAGRQTNVASLAAATLRLCTPIALGALAGIYAERSGVINIAIEGMMLTGAAFGFAAFAFTGSLWAGVACAVVLGSVIALLHGMLSITFKTDQIISGTVINILAIGVTGYLRRQYLVTSGGSGATLPTLEIPLLSDIPILGPVFFVGKPIFFTMIMLVLISHLVLFYTRWGLRMRAVGENPKAADTVGINVNWTRYMNIALSGAIAGLGGAWFSLETVGNFDDGMTAGKGFIALAAMIFGKWMPFGAFAGALLFGFAEALGVSFQIVRVEAFGVPVPTQFLQMLPYVVTIVVLAGLIGRAVGPAAAGKPYEK